MKLILRTCDGLPVTEIPWDTTKHTGCPELVVYGDRVYFYDSEGNFGVCGDDQEPIYVETPASTYVHPEEITLEWKYSDGIIELAEKIKQHKQLKAEVKS